MLYRMIFPHPAASQPRTTKPPPHHTSHPPVACIVSVQLDIFYDSAVRHKDTKMTSERSCDTLAPIKFCMFPINNYLSIYYLHLIQAQSYYRKVHSFWSNLSKITQFSIRAIGAILGILNRSIISTAPQET